MLNKLIEALETVLIKEMGENKFSRFQEASNHPYKCECDICNEWWEIMGEEDDEG